jgi:hypothetical protein
MSRRVCVVPSAKVSEVDFSKVLETNPQRLIWNTSKTETFVKFDGDKPRCLYGMETYTLSQWKAILNDPDGEWNTDPNT